MKLGQHLNGFWRPKKNQLCKLERPDGEDDGDGDGDAGDDN